MLPINNISIKERKDLSIPSSLEPPQPKSQSPNSPQKESVSLQIKKIKTSNQAKEFIQNLAPYATYTQQMTGIPASVTLAQAALESGWGKHAPGNNFFGIKGTGPAGRQRLRTTEIKNGTPIRTHAWFRKYHDPFESFLDHAKVISEGRYLKHAMAHTSSPREFVTALQSGKAKYATDPNYVEKIMKMIEKYHLEKYDLPSSTSPQSSGVES